MALDIETAAEFQTMLAALAEDIVYANIYLKLWQDIHESAGQVPRRVTRARTNKLLTGLGVSEVGVCREIARSCQLA